MDSRIYITGLGIISASGNGIEATEASVSGGISCIGEIRYLSTGHRSFPTGEVPYSNEELAAIAGVLPTEDVRELRTVLLGIIAAREAMVSAGIDCAELSRTAFINGTTVGGMDYTERHFGEVLDKGVGAEGCKALVYNDCGSSTDLIAKALGSFAMHTTVSTACSSAANAIIMGARMIKAGLVDRVVAGGTEGLSRFHLNGFNTLMILSESRCRPFDKNHQGINLGEGAAYLVLESGESMKKRSARPLAELMGYGNACDAYHQTATSVEGEGPFRAMSGALKMAGLNPDDIDYVNCHGTGTPNNDASELAAMRRVWTGCRLPHYSSTKGLTGHTTSASGAIEAVISVLALNEGFMPASAGCTEPMEEDYPPVMQTVRGCTLRYVMNNSFGFGGNDSSMILRNMASGERE